MDEIIAVLKSSPTHKPGGQFGNDNASKTHIDLDQIKPEMNWDVSGDKEFQRYADESFDLLTPAQKNTLEDYTSENDEPDEGYKLLNGALRSGKPLDQWLAKAVENMDTAMRPLPWDAIVFRGTTRHIDGNIVRDRAFTSTSAARKTFLIFGPDKLRIYLPKGTPAIVYGKQGEQEIILPRNSRFKVLRDRDMENVGITRKLWHEVDLVYLPQKRKSPRISRACSIL